MRTATAQVSPTASLVSSISSRSSRAAVLEAAAVLVAPVVVPARQEMHRQREVVAGIDIDEVEAGLARVERALAMPAAYVADVVLVHRPRGDRIDAVGTGRADGASGISRDSRFADAVAVMDELDAGEAAVRVDKLGRARQIGDVLLVPKPHFLLACCRSGGCRIARCRRPPSRPRP